MGGFSFSLVPSDYFRSNLPIGNSPSVRAEPPKVAIYSAARRGDGLAISWPSCNTEYQKNLN
ncbi:MAG: hypothetical protein RMJ07_06575 [Nitrososphaerota archaeon]|nr:hypothetical protein [Candidatus Bathyarchaeota archaeon]MDW8049319.1 hypothetical protein [Nitrososphaerota archaeon]